MAKNYNNMYNPENAPEEVKDQIAKVEDLEQEVNDFKEEKIKKTKEGKVIGGIQLNVRETPGGTIKTTIQDGTKVTIKSSFRDDEWFQITTPVEGYVMRKFIEV